MAHEQKNKTIVITPSQPRGGTPNKKQNNEKVSPSQPRGGTRTKNKSRGG